MLPDESSMQLSAVSSLSGHAVFLLLVQLALLLLVARLGASLARFAGLPAVVGELAAGIVLGPSLFGHYFPGAFATVFPQESAQFHLLEVVGQLGMVLLLLLTGLETDLRLLKNLGRAALVASAMGMVVPFAFGFGLGQWMPDEYLAQPDRRTLFSAFLATAMAISAMPVIAKILMDLDLTRRNIGLVILSAGVVDDTAGWLVLSVIAGAAVQGGSVQLAGVGLTIAYLAAFLLLMAFVIYPFMRWLMRLATTRFNTPHTDLVFVIALTFLGAAATEKMGVHAVFGAFIVGTVLRQVPQLSPQTVHHLEAFVFSILAPVFFGIVGLKVDLWALGGGGGTMLGLVLGIACLGKLLGCTVGSLWGGLNFWEALSIAVAMNARGAMELVVASIGLSLGILNPQMFSIIVVVAIATSFMAPLGLRLTMRMVRMSDEEAQRLRRESHRGALDPTRVRIMVPTAAGPNALEASRIASRIAKGSENPLEVLYVDAKSTTLQRFLRLFRPDPAGHGLATHMQSVQDMAEGGLPPRVREVASPSVSAAIIAEAQKGIDVIMIGASGRGAMLGGRVLEEVIVAAPCHVVIVRAGAQMETHRRIFVPIDGSMASRVAAEFALLYAQTAGAELTLGVIQERPSHDDDVDALPRTWPIEPSSAKRKSMLHDAGSWPHARTAAVKSNDPSQSGERAAPQAPLSPAEELERISPAFHAADIAVRLLHLQYDPARSSIVTEVAEGKYDLVVLGAENRAITNRMFFGFENQRIIEQVATTTLIVVPKLAMLR
jgi:Kef-type K+ transport system membrane component KefB/nucleotide-binding universal stress UspA family protein